MLFRSMNLLLPYTVTKNLIISLWTNAPRWWIESKWSSLRSPVFFHSKNKIKRILTWEIEFLTTVFSFLFKKDPIPTDNALKSSIFQIYINDCGSLVSKMHTQFLFDHPHVNCMCGFDSKPIPTTLVSSTIYELPFRSCKLIFTLIFW